MFHRLSMSDYFRLPLVGGGGVAELGLKGQMEQSISDFPGIFFRELGIEETFKERKTLLGRHGTVSDIKLQPLQR